MITKEDALKFLKRLKYDKKTGNFIWANARQKCYNGKIAGSLNINGYRIITINQKPVFAHHLVWLKETGEWRYKANDSFIIDHRDNDKLNNQFKNLRLVTQSTNQLNVKNPRYTNASGSNVPNVYYEVCKDLYRVLLTVDGKRKHIGYYLELEDAEKAAIEAREKYYPLG